METSSPFAAAAAVDPDCPAGKYFQWCVRQKTAIKIIRRTINVIEKNNNRSTSLVFFVVLTYRKRRNINAIQAVSDCHA